MFFTSKEKQAIIVVGQMIVCADGEIAPDEIKFEATVLKRINITSTEIREVRSMRKAEAINIISQMTQRKKKFVFAFLCGLIIADDDIDDKEIALLRFLQEVCDLPEFESETELLKK